MRISAVIAPCTGKWVMAPHGILGSSFTMEPPRGRLPDLDLDLYFQRFIQTNLDSLPDLPTQSPSATHNLNTTATHNLDASATHDLNATATHNLDASATHDLNATATHNLDASATHNLDASATHNLNATATHNLDASATHDLNATATHNLDASATHNFDFSATHNLDASATHDSKRQSSEPVYIKRRKPRLVELRHQRLFTKNVVARRDQYLRLVTAARRDQYLRLVTAARRDFLKSVTRSRSRPLCNKRLGNKELINDMIVPLLHQWTKANALFKPPVINQCRTIELKLTKLWHKAVETSLGKRENNSHIDCGCPREKKILVLELEFIKAQRTKAEGQGSMQMGSIDYSETKKQIANAKKREQIREREQKKKMKREEAIQREEELCQDVYHFFDSSSDEQEATSDDIPPINANATKLSELVDLSLEVLEPPLTTSLTSQELRNLKETPMQVPKWPSHTQSVERCVKMVTEAAGHVYSHERRE
ncbi:hypothetical protein Hamer_G029678, partial [Homarus americanus]